MKKLLSLVLALITAMSLSLVGFAHENVDNTFDNFNPAPGVQAPDNWYDPLSYDDDGTINYDCLLFDGPCAKYCPVVKKIYCTSQAVEIDDTHHYYPYEFYDEELSTRTLFCPYCGAVGRIETNSEEDHEMFYTHLSVYGVIYGFHCTECGGFNATYGMWKDTKYRCYHCKTSFIPDGYYRFTSDEQKNATYSHIFEESAYKYIDGKDYRIEDLKSNKMGGYKEWREDPYNQPNAFVRFFRNIGDMFRNFFKWIASWFK